MALLSVALVLPGTAAWGDESANGPIQPIGAPPWIGVTMDAGSDIGVPVLKVVKGSPADKGGLKAGDRIVSVDGTKVTAPVGVTKAVQAKKVGDVVSVEVERSGASKTQSVTLTARPTGDQILKMDLVGSAAPAFTNVSAMTGAPSQLSTLKGKVIIVDFWASWCGPCRLIAPKLGALKDKFGAQGLSVVGVTTDEQDVAAEAVAKHGMKYSSVIDSKGDTSKAYGVTNLPTMLVIDKKGVVRDVFVGFDSATWSNANGDSKIETLVKSLIAEK